MKCRKIRFCLVLGIFLILFSSSAYALLPDQAGSDDPLARIKDIARIDGVRSNELIGYGVVVGLDGTGDSQNNQATVQSISNMLQGFGIDVPNDELGSDNAAAVMVTAQLPAFANEGDNIDVTLSSLGDADSLQGGTLLMTPLQGPSGDEVYALAQGSVSVGGFQAGQGGAQATQNHVTVGRVPNGATIERGLETEFTDGESFTLILSNPNFATAQRTTEVINNEFGYRPDGENYARAIDASRVEVQIPENYRNNTVEFISRIEELEVRPDTEAKVVVNERTGTIVMGHNVRLSRISVSHGDLTVTIATTQEAVDVGEDGAEIIEDEELDVEEEEANLMVLPKGSSVADIVEGLNAVGATPRDVISILQAVDQAGALHGDLEIM